jgi:hypothetical protein
MTLKEYSKSIRELAAKYPDALVISASDNEGNSFQTVHCAGTLGFFSKYSRSSGGEFVAMDSVEESPDDYEHFVGKEPDAVCVN